MDEGMKLVLLSLAFQRTFGQYRVSMIELSDFGMSWSMRRYESDMINAIERYS